MRVTAMDLDPPAGSAALHGRKYLGQFDFQTLAPVLTAQAECAYAYAAASHADAWLAEHFQSKMLRV